MLEWLEVEKKLLQMKKIRYKFGEARVLKMPKDYLIISTGITAQHALKAAHKFNSIKKNSLRGTTF